MVTTGVAIVVWRAGSGSVGGRRMNNAEDRCNRSVPFPPAEQGDRCPQLIMACSMTPKLFPPEL